MQQRYRILRQRIGIDPDASSRHDARRALLRNPHVPRLRRRVRRDGRLRQARLRRGRDRRHAARRPLRRSPPRCSGRCLAAGGARELRALGRPRRRRRPRARRVRLRAPGRLLLRRARAHRRLAAVAAALHVPGDRRRRRGRARPRAARRAARWPRWRSRPAGSCSSWPAPGRARSTRSAPRSGSAPRSSTAPTSSSASGIAGAIRPRVLVGARLHRRGGVARPPARRCSASCAPAS